MKIIHICLAGPYTDGAIYQENILAKYHFLSGNEVYMIANLYSYNNQGKVTINEEGSYIGTEGYKVMRITANRDLNSKIKKYKNLYNMIESIKPDLIFSHGFQYFDIMTINKYVRKNKVKFVVDNHADFTNSARNFLSKTILHKIIWRYVAQIIKKRVNIFYGVTPGRVNFLNEIYRLPKNKIKLLMMGIDDQLERKVRMLTVNDLRNKYNIPTSSFVVCTGGKLDQSKKDVIKLIIDFSTHAADNEILLVFGSIDFNISEVVNEYFNEKVRYVGWLDTQSSYEIMLLSNLIIYPGRHSVYWEQSVGLGIPTIFSIKKGFEHLNYDRNCLFMEDIIANNYYELIKIVQSKYLIILQEGCKSNLKINFFYSKIAQDVLLDVMS